VPLLDVTPPRRMVLSMESIYRGTRISAVRIPPSGGSRRRERRVEDKERGDEGRDQILRQSFHHDVPAMTMRDDVAAPPFFPKLSQIIRQRPGRVGSYNPTVLARPLAVLADRQSGRYRGADSTGHCNTF
jgi:hypothetical protein